MAEFDCLEVLEGLGPNFHEPLEAACLPESMRWLEIGQNAQTLDVLDHSISDVLFVHRSYVEKFNSFHGPWAVSHSWPWESGLATGHIPNIGMSRSSPDFMRSSARFGEALRAR